MLIVSTCIRVLMLGTYIHLFIQVHDIQIKHLIVVYFLLIKTNEITKCNIFIVCLGSKKELKTYLIYNMLKI